MRGKLKFIEDVKKTEIGDEVIVYGWIQQTRKMGKILFVIVRDRTSHVQVLFKDKSKEIMERAATLSHEDVVSIKGVLKEKKDRDGTTSIEIEAVDLKILSKTLETPPFSPLTVDKTNEITRLKYRYLDLRSHEKQEMLQMRSKVISITSSFLERKGFLSTHTPILAKPTPEGARDFVIPSREYKDKYYALPQSPQIYKQLLMASGVERYYQIAPSFRDEDARGDRHQEFYEIDLEASYVKGDEIRRLITTLFRKIATLVVDKKNFKEHVTWRTLKYREAMRDYGSDKPDLRFDLKIVPIKDHLTETNLKKLDIDLSNKRMLLLGNQEEECLKGLIKHSKLFNNQIPYDKGFSIISYNEKKKEFSVFKYVEGTEKNLSVALSAKATKDFSNKIIFIAHKTKKVRDNWKDDQLFSHVRNYYGKKYLINEKSPRLAFGWVVNYPQFERNKDGKGLTSIHHPFAKPNVKTFKQLNEKSPLRINSTSFDLICNGFELGSGSERIINRTVQNKIFEILELDKDEIQEKFGFFLEAFKYGVPPHAGIGIGLERILMVLMNKSNIRDVIPFPKSSDGFDHMTNAPSFIKKEERS